MVLWWVYFSKFTNICAITGHQQQSTLIGQLFIIFRKAGWRISATHFDFWYMRWVTFPSNWVHGWVALVKNPSGTPLPRPKLSTPPPPGQEENSIIGPQMVEMVLHGWRVWSWDFHSGLPLHARSWDLTDRRNLGSWTWTCLASAGITIQGPPCRTYDRRGWLLQLPCGGSTAALFAALF